MAESRRIRSKRDNNEEYKEKPVGEEGECNLQTPLMFSRCSSLGSLTSIEQHSVNDDWSSVVSEFSPRISRAASPNELSESSNKYKNQKKSSNIHLSKKNVPDNISFHYDTAFKKPHFLKHSVFEDDIAAFKDESTPNLLSTAASSLSSLTIDDDDYSTNVSPNKAGLVKRKGNIQEQWRQEPIGAVSEPVHVSNTSTESKITSRSQFDKFSNVRVTKCSYPLYEEQCSKEQEKRANSNVYKTMCTKKSTWSSLTNQYCSEIPDTRVEADGIDSQELSYTTHLHIQLKDKSKTVQQTKETSSNKCKAESDLQNRLKDRKNDKCYKQEESIDFHRNSNEMFLMEENNELNAYEEQLLDQCIRKGMAKVTKRNMGDIRPFCWDVNQICLTTRAMFKNHDDDILKERKEERNKRRLYKKTSSKRYNS